MSPVGGGDVYVVDLTHDAPGELLCFCPVEMENGVPVSIVTGFTVLSTEPPNGAHCIGLFHEDGPDPCEEWAKANRALFDELSKRYGWDER